MTKNKGNNIGIEIHNDKNCPIPFFFFEISAD